MQPEADPLDPSTDESTRQNPSGALQFDDESTFTKNEHQAVTNLIPTIAASLIVFQTAARGDELLDNVLKWLPADTQTVMVARGPFTLRIEQDGELPLDEAMRQLTASLTHTQAERFAKRFCDHTILLAVEGSRRFRAPKRLGMMPYEGAQVLVFKDDLGAKGKEFIWSARETVAGQTVLIYTERWNKMTGPF